MEDEGGEVLLVEVGDHVVALPLRQVRELVRAARVTPLPGAPPGVDGVLDVRGTLVPVVDARVPLGLPPRPVDPSQVLVLAEARGRLVALRVDGARALARVGGDHGRIGVVGEVARAGETLVLLEDVEALVPAALAEPA